MKTTRFHLTRVTARRRNGAIHVALACGVVAASVFGTLSLEYWSGRTVQMLFDAWQGMTLESYRNLILVTAILGWLVSQSSESRTTHRRQFRP